MENKLIVVSLSLFLFSSCAQNPVVWERQTKGQIALEKKKRVQTKIDLYPASHLQIKNNIEVSIRYLPGEELNKIFKNKELFGRYAGRNPYPRETIVFYVKIANNSESRIHIDPHAFVVIDNLGSQYSYLSSEYITAVSSAKSSVYTFTKTTAEVAPGIYGAPADIAKSIAGGSLRKQKALLKQVELTGGYVYNDVVYDGYIAFLKPHSDAKKIKLIISNVKTKFDVNDEALESIDFEFEFLIQPI